MIVDWHYIFAGRLGGKSTSKPLKFRIGLCWTLRGLWCSIVVVFLEPYTYMHAYVIRSMLICWEKMKGHLFGEKINYNPAK